MLGHKTKEFKVHTSLSLEHLIPRDHFYRQLEATLDLSFVRDLVADRYAPLGRPSIDPVVFFKLHLIMFFEDIRSERRLLEVAPYNLAHRWYLGYDFEEALPDRSSLSKIRDRYGLEVFERFFEYIVDLCRAAGLVWGKELYFDGTRVQANASADRLVPRFYAHAKEHLAHLFGERDLNEAGEAPAVEAPSQVESVGEGRVGVAEEAAPAPAGLLSLVERYGTPPPVDRSASRYHPLADYFVNLTDPDATPLRPSGDDRGRCGYHTHYVVDGGRDRIILAALVTPAAITDNMPMLDLERWVRFRWRLHPLKAVGDTKYGTIPNVVGLEDDGIRAFLPMRDYAGETPFYAPDLFTYDPIGDLYHCPQGQPVRFWTNVATLQFFRYRADPATCNACPVKGACTASRSGRQIRRSWFQAYLDRVKRYGETPAFAKAMRKRQVWVEPMFGEAKQWHHARRFRLRRRVKVNIEALLTAAGQNIKRLLRPRRRDYGPGPGTAPRAVCLLPLASCLLRSACRYPPDGATPGAAPRYAFFTRL